MERYVRICEDDEIRLKIEQPKNTSKLTRSSVIPINSRVLLQ